MALLFFDGFDHYNSSTDFNSRSGFVQYISSGSLLSGAGRNGHGKAWNGTITATIGQRMASAFVGVSADMTSGNDIIFSFIDTVANSTQVTVVFRARNFSIEVWRGSQSTLLYRSANNVWGTNVYNFLEVWPVIDNAAGSVKVQVNNQLLVNVSGLDTQNSSNAWWDQVMMSGAAWDDFYYCDTTVGPGTNPCDTFIGDPRVYTQYPSANAAVQFVPLANTNWQEVSETAMDSDTSYNYSGTVGQEDLLSIGATPSTITGILAVQVTGAYRKDDAGLRRMKSALKSGATEQYGINNYLADTSYHYYSDVWAVDPSTSVSWLKAAVDALSVGYNVGG